MQEGALATTLRSFDLTPATPSLIVLVEVHPLFAVTGVEWLFAHSPDRRRVALCSQNDTMDTPSLATYRAAFRSKGMPVAQELRYDPQTQSGMVRAMLAASPKVLCCCSSDAPMIHAL